MPTLPDLNLKVELIAEGRDNRPGIDISPTFITIHNTDNDSPGADANAHSSFVRNVGFYMLNGEKHPVSWHFSVDDKRAIRHLPLDELGFHAKSGNGKSVAIEICMHRGIDQGAANTRAALLVATLMKSLFIPIEKVVTHKHWTGKACPSKLLNGVAEGAKWQAFRTEVRGFATAIAGGEGPIISSIPIEGPVGSGRPRRQPVARDLERDLDHEMVRAAVSGQ